MNKDQTNGRVEEVKGEVKVLWVLDTQFLHHYRESLIMKGGTEGRQQIEKAGESIHDAAKGDKK